MRKLAYNAMRGDIDVAHKHELLDLAEVSYAATISKLFSRLAKALKVPEAKLQEEMTYWYSIIQEI